MAYTFSIFQNESDGIPLNKVSTAFTTSLFFVSRPATISITGLTTDSVSLQFTANPEDPVWEDTGLVFDSTNKIETIYGAGNYRLVRLGTLDNLTLSRSTAAV